MKLRKNAGFTLLELMIVVVIMGILSAVILAVLTDARKKGDDAAVQSNLHTVANEAGIFYSDNGNSYGEDFADSCPIDTSGNDMFSKDKTIHDAITEAVKRGNGSFCYASADAWVVAVGLKVTPSASWCVDSEGAAVQVPHIPDLAIDGNTFTCNITPTVPPCIPSPGHNCKIQIDPLL
jgi:prepilin-type N-terminal cleavage/methylation domain-containing protein